MSAAQVSKREKTLRELIARVHDGALDHATVGNEDFEAGFRAGYARRIKDEDFDKKRLPAMRKALR